ncbi:MAG: hypothetical protein Q8S13_12070 [Dehalococcoidia bacterium]|nr:hypothetical protein [Dehalococcoidia bacterium]
MRLACALGGQAGGERFEDDANLEQFIPIDVYERQVGRDRARAAAGKQPRESSERTSQFVLRLAARAASMARGP